jgi:vitamin B12 transporter
MKKEKRTLALPIIAASLIACAPAFAQDTLRTNIGEVNITATRSEKNVAETGRSVTVITPDDIKRSGANTLAEVLSMQEGIYLVGTGQNFGNTQTLFVRGTASNQTALLIDGVRVLDPSSVNNAPDLSELSLADIEKIEIVRGSHSTHYGSSAIGGVVNIITKKGMKQGLNIDASATAGSFGEETSFLQENVALNYTCKSGFYVGAEIFNTSVSGIDATVDTVTNPNVFNPRDRDDFEKVDMIGKAGFRNDKLDVYFSARSTHQLTDIDERAFIDDDNYTLDFNRKLFTYGAGYRLNDHIGLKYIGGFSNMVRVAEDDSSVVDNLGNYDRTYYTATYEGAHSTNELQGNFSFKGIDAVIGGGYYNEQMTLSTYYYSNLFGPPAFESKIDLDSLGLESSTLNFFAHADVSGEMINEKYKAFNLGLGARMNNHSVFGSYLTYEINPSLKISDNGLIYASYSTGFNAPTLYQLYSPEKNYMSNITRGNPGLDPETSTSYEFGVKQKVGKDISFTFAFFHTITENMIEYAYLWDKNVAIDTLGNDWMRDDYRGDTYLNIGTQVSKGMEVGINSKLAEKLWLNGNFTIVRGSLEYSAANLDTAATQGNHVQLYNSGAFLNKDVEIDNLVRRPRTANIALTWKPWEKLTLRASMRHVGARKDIYYETALGPYGALSTTDIASYTLFDALAGFSFNEHTSAMIRVENVFDTDYTEIQGYSTRGRSAYITLRYSF